MFLFAGNCKATMNNISCRWQYNTSNMSLNTNVTPLFQWIRLQQFLLLHVKGTIHIPSWVEKRLFMKFLKQEISLRPKQIQRYTHCITKQKRHTQSCRRLKSLIWNARSQKKTKKTTAPTMKWNVTDRYSGEGKRPELNDRLEELILSTDTSLSFIYQYWYVNREGEIAVHLTFTGCILNVQLDMFFLFRRTVIVLILKFTCKTSSSRHIFITIKQIWVWDLVYGKTCSRQKRIPSNISLLDLNDSQISISVMALISLAFKT